jgi:hypothetical protein
MNMDDLCLEAYAGNHAWPYLLLGLPVSLACGAILLSPGLDYQYTACSFERAKKKEVESRQA